MEQAQFDSLLQWFENFVKPYLETDEEGRRNILLKIVHTRKVCEAMALLCAGEGLSPEETRIASAVALLHDVGRFPQYRRWRTFRDSDSDNHARLAIDVIREEKLLSCLEQQEQLLIEEAVRFHNLLELPSQAQSLTRLYIKLIRDADKIDIWRVFSELLALPDTERASAATLGLADLPEVVSDGCINALANGSVVQLDSVRTLNDFKLLQISWVYDLNFASSRRLLLERGHIPALASYLPERDDIRAAVARALASLSDGRQ
ncbi:MAG: HD domain-containing protein [Deltaproteobacteria bacterium]|nr:HD domain-containing protein [Deltaproteobacteria bacterium]